MSKELLDLIEDITTEDLQDEILDEDTDIEEESEDQSDERIDEAKKKMKEEDDEDSEEYSDSDEDDEVKEAKEDDEEDELDEEADEDDDEDEEDEEKKESVTPRTKAGLINAVYQHLSQMATKEDLTAAYNKLMGISEEAEEAEEETNEVIESSKEELEALMEAQESMDEEFRGEALKIFEAAVKKQVEEKVNESTKETIENLEESFEQRVEEGVDSAAAELVEKIDSYLSYTIQNWINENNVAIENGLRTEIAEDFMTGLRNLFEENYISVPEGKEDMVESLSDEVDKLEEDLTKQTENNIALNEELAVLKREKVLNTVAEDLTLSETNRLTSLVEDVEFEDAESFETKVRAIKESYFNDSRDNDTLNDDADGIDEVHELSPEIAAIANAISTIKKHS